MKKSLVITLLICIVSIAIAVGGYVFLKSSNQEDKKKTNEQANTVESNNSKENNIITNNNENIGNKPTVTTSNNKIAVIYFSATGNTKQIAEFVKEGSNADIFEIIPKQKYTSEDLNYGDNNTRATREQNDKFARPEIENAIDVTNYQTIFLGYPIWWGDVPKIILSFMDSANLNGKTIIPFCTSGSSDISSSENTLKEYNSNVNWIQGKRFSGSASKEEIKNWIDSLDLKLTEQSDNVGDEISMDEFIIKVNGRELVVKAEENLATKELISKLKQNDITIRTNDYGNFEKVGDLGFSLTREDVNITTEPGDIVLYQGNQISLFYNSNSWNYTKLGKIQNVDSNELKEILGSGDITLTLSVTK